MNNKEKGYGASSVKHATTDDYLELFTEVYDGYRISSVPYDSREEAYREIKNWVGDVTTYFYNGRWYIISK